MNSTKMAEVNATSNSTSNVSMNITLSANLTKNNTSSSTTNSTQNATAAIVQNWNELLLGKSDANNWFRKAEVQESTQKRYLSI